jgi:hypothetical protein
MNRTRKLLLSAATFVVVAGIGVAAYLIVTYGINPYSITRRANTKPFIAEQGRLLEVGNIRHGDTSLSPIGRSCNTCHLHEDSYNATFNEPFPQYVHSVRWKTGLSKITAEGMVRFCMVSAMQNRSLAWDSETLAALTAFVLDRHANALARALPKPK